MAHVNQSTGILKKSSYPMANGRDEVDLTWDDTGDSMSHTSSSSSDLPGRNEEQDESSERSCSESSSESKEEERVASDG